LINITDLPMSLPVLGEGQKRKNPVTWNSQSEVNTQSGDKQQSHDSHGAPTGGRGDAVGKA
jgi:hypothetical protein